MPTLVGQPAADDASADASGQVRVVAGLSTAGEDERPCVVTFVRRLGLEDASGYGGKEAGLEREANQVRRRTGRTRAVSPSQRA